MVAASKLNHDKARAKVRELVARFENLTAAERRAYNETATRNDFIDPLFEALGWDMHDNAEVAREVTVGQRKRVDYAFKVRGVSRFLLEAKSLGDRLEGHHVEQAINYAWNAGVDWVVLCHFSELKLFYASSQRAVRMRPLLELSADKFEEDFEKLWLLGKVATEKHELAQNAVGIERRKPVEELLFDDLGKWRRDLLGQIQNYHKNWSDKDAEEAIQRILNRIIFIRSVEDREIENRRLEPLLRQFERQSAKLPNALADLFREMDCVYNAGLFQSHFSEGYKGEALSLVQLVDGLIKGRDGTPYDFAAIGADVLGAIYEQYLTWVQIPDEQDRKKKQGVYYTPRFVVSYIVRNTLSRALESSYKQGGLEASRSLRVLDPACGSGSFLIAAFDSLDEWFAQNDPSLKDAAKRRQHILEENLFGVDLDPLAVEVTHLNLWLRAVDARELLPRIPNIREGNSLIDEDFDWQQEFPQVLAAGGFDVVVGNPPYVRQEKIVDFKDYAEANYLSFARRADLYVYFYERALSLLRTGGFLGFISSNKFFRAKYGLRLRNLLANRSEMQDIVDLAGSKVFKDVAVDPAIVVAQKCATQPSTYEFYFSEITDVGSSDFKNHEADFDIAVSDGFAEQNSRALTSSIWSFSSSEDVTIFEQMRSTGVELKDYLDTSTSMVRGIVTGKNEAFIIRKGLRDAIIRANPNSATLLLPILAGKDLHRYHVVFDDHFLIGIYTGWTQQQCGSDDPEEWMRANHHQIMEHLSRFIPAINGRKNQGQYWWESYPPKSRFDEYERPKLIYPEISPEGRFTLDEMGYFPRDTTHIIATRDLYLLGVLNSSLVLHYFKKNAAALGSTMRNAGLRWKKPYVERIPIVRAAASDPHRQTIERSVRAALEHGPRHAEAMKGSREHEELGRRLAALDAEIDEAVCSLYGLTDAQCARVLAADGA